MLILHHATIIIPHPNIDFQSPLVLDLSILIRPDLSSPDSSKAPSSFSSPNPNSVSIACGDSSTCAASREFHAPTACCNRTGLRADIFVFHTRFPLLFSADLPCTRTLLETSLFLSSSMQKVVKRVWHMPLFFQPLLKPQTPNLNSRFIMVITTPFL